MYTDILYAEESVDPQRIHLCAHIGLVKVV